MINLNYFICKPIYNTEDACVYTRQVFTNLSETFVSEVEIKSFWHGDYYVLGSFRVLSKIISEKTLAQMKEMMFQNLIQHHFPGVEDITDKSASYEDRLIICSENRMPEDGRYLKSRHLRSIVKYIEGFQSEAENDNFFIERLPF